MKISAQGQITIPQELRDQFGLAPFVEVEFTPTERGLLIRKCEEQPMHPFERVVGTLPPGNIVEQLGGSDAYFRYVRGHDIGSP
jgi:AbrB family looped-hinge helix DNA binding protein